MRQAGRYLQCYKDVRAKGGGTFLDVRQNTVLFTYRLRP